MYELIGTIVVQAVIAVFVYGRLTERVAGHGKRIETLEGTSNRHEGEIGELRGMVESHVSQFAAAPGRR